jgi:hypothetical protein
MRPINANFLHHLRLTKKQQLH